MLRISAFSDTHGQHQEVARMELIYTDVAIFAGDWTRGRDTSLIETVEFIEWFSELPCKYKLLVAGNHETTVEGNPDMFAEILGRYPSVTYLDNRAVTIEGVTFFGSPYSNTFGGLAFMEDELELAEIWDEIPEETNVLITHGPAYGVLDKVNNTYTSERNVGSQSLTVRKENLPNLQVHICGHIHEGHGFKRVDKVRNYNVACLDERYKWQSQPTLLQIQV